MQGGQFRLTVDRFEGEWAVLEYERKSFSVPRVLLPPQAQAGDVLTVSFAVDRTSTKRREQRVRSLMEELFEKGSGSS